jgi:hypothetical protein
MNTTRLRELLRELHEELDRADSVEPESQELLRNVMDDIEGVLERSEGAGDDSITDRLNHAVVDFEATHPKLSYTIERLVKSLSDIGI